MNRTCKWKKVIFFFNKPGYIQLIKLENDTLQACAVQIFVIIIGINLVSVYVGMNSFRPYYPGLMVLNSLLYEVLLVRCMMQPLENVLFFSREFSTKYYLGQINQHFN